MFVEDGPAMVESYRHHHQSSDGLVRRSSQLRKLAKTRGKTTAKIDRYFTTGLTLGGGGGFLDHPRPVLDNDKV